MPPGCSVWQSLVAGSWCCHLKPFPRFSERWAVWTKEGAATVVLQRAWRLYLDENGLDERDCPIQGLLATEVQRAGA